MSTHHKNVPSQEKAFTSIEGDRNLDSEALKQEYENFAYIVSHDLNAPLRHIREFTRILMNKLGDKVSGEEKYVKIIENSVEQADSMLQGLLDFSRLNTRAKPFEDFDCTAALKQVIQSHRRQMEDNGVKIHYENLPKIHGDEGQIKLLFFHLLDNAIKFRREGVFPEIHIRAVKDKEGWLFQIQDNGVGMDPAVKDQIFTLFRKFHPHPEMPGNGTGLTLCKKIVTHHGGKIWCVPADQQGTIVNFTLPAAKV